LAKGKKSVPAAALHHAATGHELPVEVTLPNGSFTLAAVSLADRSA